MKRKTSAAPSRVYTYGCRPPIEGFKQLDDQLFRAHRYRNGLVEIERRRRERIAQAQAKHGALGPLLIVIDYLSTQIAEDRKAIKLARSGSGNMPAVIALRARIAAARVDLSVLRWLLGWCRTQAKTDQALAAEYAKIEAAVRMEIKALRGSAAKPYWGSYLAVERSAEAWRKSPEPPRFLRYTGEGRVVVQIQKGMPVAQAYTGKDTRLRILPATPRVRRDGSAAPVKDTYRTAWIRVASTEKGKPVWAVLPMVMHRELPTDGRIMWAWILRRRVGVRYTYELQITVEAESFARAAGQLKCSDTPAPKPDGTEGVIALDIGHREIDGLARVALWVDYTTGERGELRLPRWRRVHDGRQVPNGIDKAKDLRSIRDRRLDVIRDLIVAHRAGASAWFRERTTHAHKWRSPARIGMLYRDWGRQEAPSGINPWADLALAVALRGYLDRDRHLLDWEMAERGNYARRRREQYRVFAVGLAKKYRTIIIADRDYRRERRPPEKTMSEKEGHSGRALLHETAPGELVACVRAAAQAHGAHLIEAVIEGDTLWAVDHRVCERMLAASGYVMQSDAEPLAQVISLEPRAKDVPAQARRLGTDERVDPLANADTSVQIP
jgi:hypothetical protein